MLSQISYELLIRQQMDNSLQDIGEVKKQLAAFILNEWLSCYQTMSTARESNDISQAQGRIYQLRKLCRILNIPQIPIIT